MAYPSWHIMIYGASGPLDSWQMSPLYVGVWVEELGAEAAMRSESTQTLLVHMPLNT